MYYSLNGMEKMKLPSIGSDLLYTGAHQGRPDYDLFSPLYTFEPLYLCLRVRNMTQLLH